jgi:antitoxin ParD1/3/4
MPTKNISLPAELDRYIDAKVASGEYAHASEVVREGVRLLMRQESDKLEWLKNAIAEGIASAETGPLYEANEQLLEKIKREGRARVAARAKMS